jgi:F0F1-type ATP synthase gamma subunit
MEKATLSYSKLKQIVKENVKAVLSENKKLISISFVALIQTIKADPQMVKLIQNIPCANDGEQHKDNDDSITKYLESNKDNLLDLAEKHYENLVEALTNNVMNTAAASPNPPFLLPQSSSTLPNLSHNDSYGIEESDTHHNSRGDIAE